MTAEVERWFGLTDALYLARLWDGRVAVVTTDGRAPNEGGEIWSETIIEDGIWGSAVLTMTAFSERPNDWHAFMDHHHGRRDLLAAATLADVDRNRADRIERAYKRLLESRLSTGNA